MNRIRMMSIAAVAALGALQSPAFGGDLEIRVGSIRSDAGKVQVALHAEGDAAKFPAVQGAIWAQWVKAAPGERRFVFTDLPAGRFAVAAFHDENDNGELDANFLGIPREGHGFSRNATGSFGPPRFAAAAVEVAADGEIVRTETELNYQED